MWGESGPKEAGLSVVTVTCRDEKMQMTYLQHESWLRPLLRSNQVEHCWCNGGRAQCHSVPVRSTCPPKPGREPRAHSHGPPARALSVTIPSPPNPLTGPQAHSALGQGEGVRPWASLRSSVKWENSCIDSGVSCEESMSLVLVKCSELRLWGGCPLQL